jgi:hypothetical protein
MDVIWGAFNIFNSSSVYLLWNLACILA